MAARQRLSTLAVLSVEGDLPILELVRRTFVLILEQHRAACGPSDCPHNWTVSAMMKKLSASPACLSFTGPGGNTFRGSLVGTYYTRPVCSDCGASLWMKASNGLCQIGKSECF